VRRLERLGHRPVPQLEGVAEEDQPVRAVQLAQQRVARAGVAQHVSLRAAAQVQVGDDHRSHAA
jgi:hypothetical protein